MFSNLPPFGLVQLQTLGGVYSGVSVILEPPAVRRQMRTGPQCAHHTLSALPCAPSTSRAEGLPSAVAMFEADAAILTVRPTLLSEIALAAGSARTAAAIADIGYGTDDTVSTRWTQHPPRPSSAEGLVRGTQDRPSV